MGGAPFNKHFFKTRPTMKQLLKKKKNIFQGDILFNFDFFIFSVFCLDSSRWELESGTSMIRTTTQTSCRWRRWWLTPTSDPMVSTMTLLSSLSRDPWPSVSIFSPSVSPLEDTLMRPSLTHCPWHWDGAPPTMMVTRSTFCAESPSLCGPMRTVTRHIFNQSQRCSCARATLMEVETRVRETVEDLWCCMTRMRGRGCWWAWSASVTDVLSLATRESTPDSPRSWTGSSPTSTNPQWYWLETNLIIMKQWSFKYSQLVNQIINGKCM